MEAPAMIDGNMQLPAYASYIPMQASMHSTTFMLFDPTCAPTFEKKDDQPMAMVSTHGESYRDWTNLVSTNEELWYERAAIWLPGHSRYCNIEPLDKLKMQNSNLENVHIYKWKFFKKILTTKGTRLYVDMPPSSARALEKHKMMLSYELQKVNVFLRTVAVDKDFFDNGLKESSLPEQSPLITAAALNSPMPLLREEETNIVKISIKTYKVLNVILARNIKERIISSIYKYYQRGGSSETNFLKYGLVQEGAYFGIIPENEKSKRWLADLNLGKFNKQPIFVLNNVEDSTLYIKMYMIIPQRSYRLTSDLILKRLKQNNPVVGLNFRKWKPLTITTYDNYSSKFEVDIDINSINALLKMGFTINYSRCLKDRYRIIKVMSPYPKEHLEKILSERKAELTDRFDVANMILVSSDDDDDDVVFVSDITSK